MKRIITIIILALSLIISAQNIEKKCKTCGKPIANCIYKGRHPKNDTGTLSITSSPSGAVVKVDGKNIGNTPLTLERQKPGTHSVTFSAEGYETQTKSVTVTAGKTATCSATLKRKQTQQTVTTTTTAPAKPNTATQAVTASYKDGILNVNGVQYKMIRVEGGTFQMGSNDGDSDEKPVHSVTLSSYYIGQTEVTQALWKAVKGNNPSSFKGDNLPVENVSWEDCQTFIRKINQLTGQKFRLPTEAEWEFAAIGGKNSRGYKYSGSSTLDDVAWYDNNSGGKTHPVATKQANELGLYDMIGNVCEWCEDLHNTSSSDRVYRGCSYFYAYGQCRVSDRSWNKPSYRYYSLGLRLAMSTNHQSKDVNMGAQRVESQYTSKGYAAWSKGKTFLQKGDEKRGVEYLYLALYYYGKAAKEDPSQRVTCKQLSELILQHDFMVGLKGKTITVDGVTFTAGY